jgi:hypothetical protein
MVTISQAVSTDGIASSGAFAEMVLQACNTVRRCRDTWGRNNQVSAALVATVGKNTHTHTHTPSQSGGKGRGTG